jgi:hypothetical protein
MPELASLKVKPVSFHVAPSSVDSVSSRLPSSLAESEKSEEPARTIVVRLVLPRALVSGSMTASWAETALAKRAKEIAETRVRRNARFMAAPEIEGGPRGGEKSAQASAQLRPLSRPNVPSSSPSELLGGVLERLRSRHAGFVRA